MEIMQIVGAGLVSALLALTLKKHAPEFSLAISICAGIFIFIMLLPKLFLALETLQTLSDSIDGNLTYVSLVFKVVGIAYISEFGAQLCTDAGQGAIAYKIELAGKIMIMVVSFPVLFALLELLQGMLS